MNRKFILGRGTSDPIESYYHNKFHKQSVKLASSHLLENYFRYPKQGEQSRYDRHSNALLESYQQRSKSKQTELDNQNTKLFLKLNAVDNRAPIYSKETIPTMPPHQILVEEKRAGSEEFKPSLNYRQRVNSHRNI
jgi:hypothetical protein